MSESHRSASSYAYILLRVGAFLVTVALWKWVEVTDSTPLVSGLIVIGSVVLVFPIVLIDRRLLDRRPTLAYTEHLTFVVHFLLMVLFGAAIVEAIQTGKEWRGVVVPVPEEIGLTFLYVTGVLTLLTVVNLAVRGLGAPFAIALSRRIATDWMYRWTRNPMVLATLAWLFSFGVWIQSLLFMAWVVLLVGPAWMAFVTWYEERELEIRFGQPYLDYKARTPLLFPWKVSRR